MTEVTKNVYCDVLSEHDGQKVTGARTYKDMIVARYSEDGQNVEFIKSTIDLCPICYAKYKINLCVQYDPFTKKPVYSFKNDA